MSRRTPTASTVTTQCIQYYIPSVRNVNRVPVGITSGYQQLQWWWWRWRRPTKHGANCSVTSCSPMTYKLPTICIIYANLLEDCRLGAWVANGGNLAHDFFAQKCRNHRGRWICRTSKWRIRVLYLTGLAFSVIPWLSSSSFVSF